MSASKTFPGSVGDLLHDVIVVLPENYPEPEDAKYTCAYCGRKTYMPPALVDDLEERVTVGFKSYCSRASCFHALLSDPDFATDYAFGHRPS